MPDILDRLIAADKAERKKKNFNFCASEEDIARIKGVARTLRIPTSMLLRIAVRYIELEYEKRVAAMGAQAGAGTARKHDAASTRDVL